MQMFRFFLFMLLKIEIKRKRFILDKTVVDKTSPHGPFTLLGAFDHIHDNGAKSFYSDCVI